MQFFPHLFDGATGAWLRRLYRLPCCLLARDLLLRELACFELQSTLLCRPEQVFDDLGGDVLALLAVHNVLPWNTAEVRDFARSGQASPACAAVLAAADDDDLELAILVVLMLFAVLEVVVRTSCGLPPTHEESTISAWGDWGSLLTII